MRTQIILISLICLASGCNPGSIPSPSSPPAPSGQLIINYPTTAGTYTTLQDTVDLSGIRSASITKVDWENLSTGATGTGCVWSRTEWCFFVFYLYECTNYYWDTWVPLREGENAIKIYGNDNWADSITVTKSPSFSVSGIVTYNGSPQLNIELSLVDATNASSLFTAYTDTAGSFRFAHVPAGTYELTPVSSCYTFSPANIGVTGTNMDVTGQNFVIIDRSGAAVSGKVTYALSGAAVFGASITLSNSSGSTTVSSNQAGYYSFTCIADGSYLITPALDPFFHLVFIPTSENVAVVNGQDVPGQDFQVTASAP